MFDFLEGTSRGLDPSKKKQIECSTSESGGIGIKLLLERHIFRISRASIGAAGRWTGPRFS
jgi:hypothetical protein